MNRVWQIVAGGAVGGAIIGAFLAARDAEGFPAPLCVLALWTAAGTGVGTILVVVDRVVDVVGRGFTLVFVRDPGPTASRGIVLLLFAAIGIVALWPAIREVAGRPLPRRLLPPDGLRTALLVAAAAFAGTTVGYSVRRRDRGPHPVLGLGLAGTAAALLIAPSFMGPIHLPALRITLVASSLVCAGLALALTLPSTAWRRPAVGLALVVVAGTFLWREGPIARFNPGHPYTATLQALWVGSGETGPATARSRDILRRWFGRQRSSMGDALDDAAPNRRSFNILWITVCTLRKDRLGAFGNPRNLTPSMDALAAQSTVFERGYSTFPASACSMQSMFTSLYPNQTGFFRQKTGRAPFAGETWLPEVLRAAGWSTWAFTALDQMMLRGDFGVLMRGFDLTNPYPNVESPDGAAIADAVEDALASHTGRAPFFLWTLLMDAHSPFEGDPTRPELGTRVEDLYDGDVSVVDRTVGRILRALSDAGRRDDTIVILHADHGEEFGDHGGRWHYSTVYDEQVAIPFMIRVPGVSPRRTPSPVDLTDLAPTVLEILDQPTLPLALGDSLVPLLLGGDLPSFAFAEVDVPYVLEARRRMVVGPDAIKLVVRGTAGSREVYDLSRDPQELNDLAAAGHPSLPELADVLTAVATFDGGALAEPTSPRRPESPGPSSAALVVRDVLGAEDAPNDHLLKALKAVVDLQLEDTVPLALSYLTHASPDVRSGALGVLFSLGGPGHRDAVLPLLADPDPQVRAGAARAMGRVGSKGDVHLLAVHESMTSDEQWQRARSRLRLGDRTGVDELATRSGTLDGAEQFFLLSELARLGDAKAAGFFLDLLEALDSTPAERWSALSVLLPAAHPTALLVFQDSIRSRAAPGDLILQGLDLIPTDRPTTDDVLLEAALHPSPNIRHRAVAALRRTHSAEDVRTLIHASQDAATRR